MSLWLWLILAGYLAGWALAVGPTLRWYMLRDSCAKCGHSDCGGCNAHRPKSCREYGRAPRGAVRERTGGDVATAISGAAFWPVRMLWYVGVVLATITGDGLTSAVLRTTPLTGPELERRLRDQQAEIARLTEQMNRK